MTVIVVSDGCAEKDEAMELGLMGGGTTVNEEDPLVDKLVVLKKPLVVEDRGATDTVLEDGRMVVNGGGEIMVGLGLRLLVVLTKPLTDEGGGDTCPLLDGGGRMGLILLLELRGGGSTLLVTLGKPGVLLGGGGSNVILLELLTGGRGGSGGTTLALLVTLNRPDVVVTEDTTTEEVVTPVPIGLTEMLLLLLVENGTVLVLLMLLLLEVLKTGTVTVVVFVVKFCRLVDGGSKLEKGDDVTLMVGSVVKMLEVVLKYPLEVVVKLARDEGAVMVTVMFSTRVMVTCSMRVVLGTGQLEADDSEEVLVSAP